MPALSTGSLPVTRLAIPLTDTPLVRWLHLTVILALLIQALVLLSFAPLASGACLCLIAFALSSLRQAEHTRGVLYLTEEGWCLVDGAGRYWRAQTQAVSMVSYACALHLRRGWSCRWVVVTRSACGTGPWRDLRRAVTLYARPARLKDRVRARLQGRRVVQGEMQPPALPSLQRAANHQLRDH